MLTPHKMTNRIIVITLNRDYDTLEEKTTYKKKEKERKTEKKREKRLCSEDRSRDGRASGPSERFLAFGKSQIELSSQPARYPRSEMSWTYKRER